MTNTIRTLIEQFTDDIEEAIENEEPAGDIAVIREALIRTLENHVAEQNQE